MSALLVKVVVDGGAVHANGPGDLGDGVLPLAVRASAGGAVIRTARFARTLFAICP